MKNSKGISLIALIITIIVIIILAAIVIGGVFNTPNDAKFANFCQEYDRVQTAIQLKYYELYQKYAISASTDIPTHYEIYAEVADPTTVATSYTGDDNIDTDAWKKIEDGAFATGKLGAKPAGLSTWYLRLSDGKLAYAGFEKEEKEMYFTPNSHVTSATRSSLVLNAGALTEDGNAVAELGLN